MEDKSSAIAKVNITLDKEVIKTLMEGFLQREQDIKTGAYADHLGLFELKHHEEKGLMNLEDALKLVQYSGMVRH